MCLIMVVKSKLRERPHVKHDERAVVDAAMVASVHHDAYSLLPFTPFVEVYPRGHLARL